MNTNHVLKLYALAATAGCGVLLSQTPPGRVTGTSRAECRPTRPALGSSSSAPAADVAQGAADHEDVLASLLAAHPGSPRCAALARLPQRVPDAAVSQAIARLLDRPLTFAERACAVDTLGALGDAGSLELLLGLARDLGTRDGALQALARRSDGQARRALLALAEDHDDPSSSTAPSACTSRGGNRCDQGMISTRWSVSSTSFTSALAVKQNASAT